MSCLEELETLQREAAERPPRTPGTHAMALNSIEFQLGYRVGWHEGMDAARDVVEECEEES